MGWGLCLQACFNKKKILHDGFKNISNLGLGIANDGILPNGGVSRHI